ncbi:flagellar filament capping protein FliD [Desulfosporosinus sp. BG]|uniref:flagellar filament capping protein FliD n=1 Tax=Desulfosporosinus sp. BG TaxID=1633135 RepID=UPI000839F10A|nr:flagellar filament capping protein FliD [Desulfosporosinus sp. BG]ODA42532.1 Flagellar hook-associated protein FliD [Desulfosporosinus sp. BG]
MTTSTTSSTASTSSLAGTYGLSGSGIDVDAIVKALMTAQQTKLDKLTQQKTVLQWQKAAYNTVYDDISTFSSAMSNYKLQKTLSPNTVSTSNASVVTAKASAAALDGTHSLVVAQLASSANLTSTEAITPTTYVSKKSITEQLYNGTEPTGALKVTIANGSSSATITVDPTGTLNDLVSQINKAGINVQASYDSNLDRFFLASTNTGAAANISITDFTSGDTDGTDFFVNKLHLPLTQVGSTDTYSSAGKDAVFQLDGARLTEPNNSFTISNITYNLTGVSSGTIPADITGTGFTGAVTSVSVSNDIDSAVKSIQSLVDSYNTILEELNAKVSEARYTDYPPLTDAQEADMSESEIKKWNEKAESGMLYNDSTLTGLINSMRSAFSSTVKGGNSTYNSASSIGITTADYTEGGKLHLDTDKLEAALSADPNVLYELFGAPGTAVTTTTAGGVTTTTKTAADGTTTTTTATAAAGAADGTTTSTEWSSQGISGRIYDSLNSARTKLRTIASTSSLTETDSSSNYALRIIALNKQITSAEDTFDMMQDTYYKQYNAMEVALQSLSSQSSWITSMLSSSS